MKQLETSLDCDQIEWACVKAYSWEKFTSHFQRIFNCYWKTLGKNTKLFYNLQKEYRFIVKRASTCCNWTELLTGIEWFMDNKK